MNTPCFSPWRAQLAALGRRTTQRLRQVTLVTSLLDPVTYPAEELAALYGRRWRLELCLRDVKTTMGMELLRCQSPAMAHKEVLGGLIAHNLVRCVMAEAARVHDARLDRLSCSYLGQQWVALLR
jgi:hypothetical protein